MSCNNRLVKFWHIQYLIVLFFCLTDAKNEINNLDKALNQTANFFDKLKSQFGSLSANNETFALIDNHVEEFIRDINNDTRQRNKRYLFQSDDYATDFGNLQGIETLPNYNIQSATDISFFIRSSRGQLTWFIAAVNSHGVSLLQQIADRYIQVSFFPLKNGKFILSESKDYSTLLIIQQNNGVIKVLRLSLGLEEKLILSIVQTIATRGANHAATWIGMNRLYLGVASPKCIRIYLWLGETFDQIQLLDFPADKLIPIQTGGSMTLAATGKLTRIISYQLKTNKFFVLQTLKGSHDAIGFQRENGYFGDNFLVLAEDNCTVIYNEQKHRYVPFQKLASAREVQVLSSDKKILLFFIEKHNGMKVFQYDGWRFLDRQMNLPDVNRVYPTFLADGLFVLVTRNIDKWTFHRMIWEPVKSWTNVRQEIGEWCEASLLALEQPIVIPELKTLLILTNAHIDHLYAFNVNGKDVQKFVNVNQKYKKLFSTLEQENKALDTMMSGNNQILCKTFSARSVKVTSKVIANNTKTVVNHELLSNLRKLGDSSKNYTFKNVKNASLHPLKCPIPAIDYEEVNVKGYVNGIPFELFAEDVLKVNAKKQVITGSYTFDKLRVETADVDLDIAWNSTRQELKFDYLIVEDLNVASGYLLPIDGQDVTMTGHLTVSKMKVTGLVHLTGPIRGISGEQLQPMIHLTDPFVLYGDYQLKDVKMVDSFVTDDLYGPTGESFKKIRSSALPLNSTRIPIHMKFHSANTEWKNVTVEEFLGNWITVKNSTVNITGQKYVNNVDILLPSVYNSLSMPMSVRKVCSTAVLTDDVYMTNITVANAIVDTLKVDQVFGALQMDEVFADSAKNWQEVPWNLKTLTGQASVKSSSISAATNFNLSALHDSLDRWTKPGILKGPLRVKNLSVKNLTTEKGFQLPFPTTIKRFQALGNVNVQQINGIAMNNVLEIDDMISLTNITFFGDVSVDKIFTSVTNIPLFSLFDGNFGKTVITKGLQTDDLIIPDSLHFPQADVPVELVIDGNVTFINEPSIKNINNFNIEKLSKEIWMKNKPAKITGNKVFFDNVTFEGSIEIAGSLKTPNHGPWSEMSSKVLSKSSDQEITQQTNFSTLQVSHITGAKTSKFIASPSTNFHDLEHYTLKNIGNQTINNSWNFDKVNIKNEIEIKGVINHLDLNNDVVKNDIEKNLITGKITVDTLTAKSISGLNFNEFAKNTLTTRKQQASIVIKGMKTFKYLKVNSLNLTSTINGKKIESCLLKNSNQLITGRKIIKGKFQARGIRTDSLVNDVDLTKLLIYQLKNNAAHQVIKTPIIFQNHLNILGNLIVEKNFKEINLNTLKSPNSSLSALLKILEKLFYFAGGVNRAVEGRAFYFEKLELIGENSTSLIEIAVNETVRFNLLGSCHIYKLILHCNGREIYDFSNKFNSSQILQLRAVSLGGMPRIVCITSAPRGGVSIYYVNEEKNEFVKEAELQIPDVLGGSMAAYKEAIWIVLTLQDFTMILRYDSQLEFQEYVLPESSQYFALFLSLSDELLLIKNDGVWRLGGLAGAKLIFSTDLHGKIQVYNDEYVQLSQNNSTTLLKASYAGN